MRSGPPIAEEFAQHLAVDFPDDPSMVPGNISRLREAMAAQFWTDEAVRAVGDVVVSHHDANGIDLVRVAPSGLSPDAACLFSVHGGGLVAGGHRSGLGQLAELALRLGVVVLAPDYRLAPEHPYPAAFDDCRTAYDWTIRSAELLGFDRDRLALMGGSAGAAIAGGLALYLRDTGAAQPGALMLIQPMLDDRNQLPSTFEIDDDIIWDRTSNATGWTAYVQGLQEVPGYAAPARAESLAGLPPTFIEIGSSDLFRDESLEFATRASRDRVPVELHLWPGGFHGFDSVVGSPIAASALRAREDYLGRFIRGGIPAQRQGRSSSALLL
ncbi:MAG: alpha/beta hydrolase [Rhodoglobus sp.]|nr:alpha/beta hydrolase [Rhodoglobus sp.]